MQPAEVVHIVDVKDDMGGESVVDPYLIEILRDHRYGSVEYSTFPLISINY